jgi:hypothetical protein
LHGVIDHVLVIEQVRFDIISPRAEGGSVMAGAIIVGSGIVPSGIVPSGIGRATMLGAIVVRAIVVRGIVRSSIPGPSIVRAVILRTSILRMSILRTSIVPCVRTENSTRLAVIIPARNDGFGIAFEKLAFEKTVERFHCVEIVMAPDERIGGTLQQRATGGSHRLQISRIGVEGMALHDLLLGDMTRGSTASSDTASSDMAVGGAGLDPRCRLRAHPLRCAQGLRGFRNFGRGLGFGHAPMYSTVVVRGYGVAFAPVTTDRPQS